MTRVCKSKYMCAHTHTLKAERDGCASLQVLCHLIRCLPEKIILTV